MIGVIFATMAEAGPFLSLSQAVKIEDAPFRIFQVPANPDLLVTVSGMGKVAAALACQTMIREYMVDEVVNAGVCGSLKSEPGFPIGAVFCIATVAEGDHEVFGVAPLPIISDGKIDWDQRAARLITCDRPVFDDDLRRTLAASAELVDMEGAAIARTATLHQIPWTMIKGITDSAGPMDRAAVSKHLAEVSEKVGQLLWARLRSIKL